MLVVAVVAMASVLGLAILSSNALQVEASRGQEQVLQADALADSAMNVGLYYLQNIDDLSKCPLGVSSQTLLNPIPYNETGTGLGSKVAGRYDLQVKRIGMTRYLVTATGRATSAQGEVTRKIVGTVEVNYYGQAAAITGTSETTTLPFTTKITGDLYAAGPLINNGIVTGTIYGNNVSGSGSGLVKSTGTLLVAVVSPLPLIGGLLGDIVGGLLGLGGGGGSSTPPPGTVNHYTSYVYKNPQTGAGTTVNSVPAISAGTLFAPNVGYVPSTANPAGVFVRDGDLDISGDFVLRGTLVVTGRLRILDDSRLTVTSSHGFPALVVDGDLVLRPKARFEAEGLVFTGGKAGKVSLGGFNSRLTVTGALITPGGLEAFDPAVRTTITYHRQKASVPNLTNTATKPASVTVVSWQNNAP
jgi:hypothetical protein